MINILYVCMYFCNIKYGFASVSTKILFYSVPKSAVVSNGKYELFLILKIKVLKKVFSISYSDTKSEELIVISKEKLFTNYYYFSIIIKLMKKK